MSLLCSIAQKGVLISRLCKLYGLRPSTGRFSYRGLSDTFVGQEAVRSNAGPMGHTPQDLELLMSSYMASKPWDADPDIVPIPWRGSKDVMPDGPLCFAISWGDELVSLSAISLLHSGIDSQYCRSRPILPSCEDCAMSSKRSRKRDT